MATYELNSEEQQVIEALRAGHSLQTDKPAASNSKADHHDYEEVLALAVYTELALNGIIDATEADNCGLSNIINTMTKVIEDRMCQFFSIDAPIKTLVKYAQVGEYDGQHK